MISNLFIKQKSFQNTSVQKNKGNIRSQTPNLWLTRAYSHRVRLLWDREHVPGSPTTLMLLFNEQRDLWCFKEITGMP